MLEKIVNELIEWRKMMSISYYNTKEKEQYYKKCYELCECVHWQIGKLQSLEEIISLMEKLAIPLNEHNYSAMLKRYLNKTLPLEQPNTRRLYL